MMYQDPPVFCDNCSFLAMAQFDGMILCAECLTKHVGAQSSEDIAKISPLNIPSPGVKTNSKNIK